MHWFQNRRTAVAALVCLLVVATAAVSLPAVLADEDAAPEPLPAEFHGTVTIDGEPAPEGTDVTATIGGEQRGSILVDERGRYGQPGALEEALTVRGERDDDGATVVFLVDGVEAEQTATWHSAATTELELTASQRDDPGSGGSAGTGSAGTSGAGANGDQNGTGDGDDGDEQSDAGDDGDEPNDPSDASGENRPDDGSAGEGEEDADDANEGHTEETASSPEDAVHAGNERDEDGLAGGERSDATPGFPATAALGTLVATCLGVLARR